MGKLPSCHAGTGDPPSKRAAVIFPVGWAVFARGSAIAANAINNKNPTLIFIFLSFGSDWKFWACEKIEKWERDAGGASLTAQFPKQIKAEATPYMAGSELEKSDIRGD
jgi:hypothetical protein